MTAQTETHDPLAAACELVGRFLFHFSRVEREMDATIAKLFELEKNSADIITANIDFNKKIYLLQSVIAVQAHEKPTSWTESAEKLLSDIQGVNNPHRQIVAHSGFEPGPEKFSVRFKRTVAKAALVRHEPVWTKDVFEGHFKKMSAFETELQKLRGELKTFSGGSFPIFMT